MRHRDRASWRFVTGGIASAVLLLGAAAFSACGGKVDDRFAAETYDEYTEPLQNVVVGTPSGVTRGGTLMPNGTVVGGVTEAVSVPVRGPASDGGTGTADAGTSSGASGSSSGAGGVGSGSGGGFGSSSSSGSSSGVISGSSSSGVGGSSGPIFDGGAFPDGGGSPAGSGFGQWHFDDCSPNSNFLIDSSGEGANAQHALGGACVPGISGQGVQIRTAKDVVQVPDEPQFTVGSLIAAAAWVHPNTVTGNQPIVIKRLNNDTSFSLGINNGNIQMSVKLASGTTVISRAPISPGVWTHVAGMYDGTFVFLFINGQQFGQVFGGGPLHNVFAPLRFGATTGSQRLDGIVDEVFVSTQSIDKSVLTALACISEPITASISPTSSPPVPFDSSFHYDINVTNNDVGFCSNGKSVDAFNAFFDPTISVNFASNFAFVTQGQTADIGVDVTPSEEADPGPHSLTFGVFDFSSFNEVLLNATLNVAQPSGCFVFTKRELMITSTGVVDDPVRTAGNTPPFSGPIFTDAGVIFPPDGGGAGGEGPWSFAHLMREMAPTPDQAPAMVLNLLQHWLNPQTVNGFTVAPRPLMQSVIIDQWPKLANGDLDLDHAPLLLEAIVNRIDIRDLSQGSAGEGRFIFGVNNTSGDFTIIVEYNLPAQTQDDVMGWANRWHALGSHPFPSEEYNQALETITRSFTDRNSMPSGVNGSALAELRTNDFTLSGFSQWELRSFALSPTSGFFDEVTVKETPDTSFNGSQAVADFVNQNGPAIKAVIPGANGNTVPLQFEGQNFMGGSSFNDGFEWGAPGIVDDDARFHMSINTCNGCHGPDTNTSFQMVIPRFTTGSEAGLSLFLTGTTAFDFFTGQQRPLNDLQRRNIDLTSLVCGTDGGAPPPPPPVDAGPPRRDGGVVIVPPPPPMDASAGPGPTPGSGVQ